MNVKSLSELDIGGGETCHYLGGDHSASGSVVGCQLHAVPSGGAQVGDDDVLLLRPVHIGI